MRTQNRDQRRGKATTATIEAPQTYIITNQAGATFTFKETPKPLAWSYAFVKNGIAGQTATPEISDNIFGEIALVNDIDLPKEVTIEDISRWATSTRTVRRSRSPARRSTTISASDSPHSPARSPWA